MEEITNQIEFLPFKVQVQWVKIVVLETEHVTLLKMVRR